MLILVGASLQACGDTLHAAVGRCCGNLTGLASALIALLAFLWVVSLQSLTRVGWHVRLVWCGYAQPAVLTVSKPLRMASTVRCVCQSKKHRLCPGAGACSVYVRVVLSWCLVCGIALFVGSALWLVLCNVKGM
jgi:hypothetical protein